MNLKNSLKISPKTPIGLGLGIYSWGSRSKGPNMVVWAHTGHRCMGSDIYWDGRAPNTQHGGWIPQHPLGLRLAPRAWEHSSSPMFLSSGAYPEPNMLGSRQRAWIHFSSLMGPSSTLFRDFSGCHASPLIFYTDPICIILSRIQLKISQGWNSTLAPHFYKRTSLMINTSWILQVKGS